MRVLGIETSCDETAAAVVDDGIRIVSSVVWSQVAIHAPYGGVVPEIASRNHMRAIVPVVDSALEQAKTDLNHIDGIAVTLGPGLIGSLLVGVQFAKALAMATSRPVVGVNHLKAHVMASFLTDNPPHVPFIALVVSGGHTSLYHVRGPGSFELLGRTLDDAAGEAMDKAAALLGLPYPGGVAIDRVSEGHNPEAVHFPRAMMDRSSFDMSFSGLKTALRSYMEGGPCVGVGDIAASFQEAVVDVLVAKTMAAARQTGAHSIVIAGGVAANRRLRDRMREVSQEARLDLHLLPLHLCTDNAAMVACLGYHYLFGGLATVSAPRGLEMDPFARNMSDGW